MLANEIYPHLPGWKGTDTSENAAASIAVSAKTLRDKALRAFATAGSTGLTAEELADHMGVARVSVQPRVSELRRLGKVRDSGTRRKNGSSGKSAAVWVLAEGGDE